MELKILTLLAVGATASIAGATQQRALTLSSQETSLVHVVHSHNRRGGPPVGAPSPTEPAEHVAFFGDTLCPCIGFDNIQGETTVVFEEGGQETAVAYPADLGARCEPWDDGRHASCKEGATPGFGQGWCAQQWCYVDPCNCAIPVLPKMSTYSPDALYRGKPLFFSYATCGGEDAWSKGVPEVGTPGCRCIGFDNVPGTTEMNIEGQMVAYPAEVGGSCKAWDKATHPMCSGGDPKKLPKWCAQEWCYVDPCTCELAGDIPPKVSMYLPKATFTGKGLYYSYETCEGKDYFTKTVHLKACVNQVEKGDCDKLSRCAWTGNKCLGAELVNHPLCEAVVKKLKAEAAAEAAAAAKKAKSSAAALRPLAAAGALAAALFSL
mmetsp:Transcript_11533/g.30593  ORF Transcript_11533/g.30593 Transcript_11533/m.30593 type:complete len:379 (-) Transcript_11533:194-1330(-)